jgi:hypothetical protein
MIKAPPCDQKHESADDCENKPLRHFFIHLVRMLKRSQVVTSEQVIRLQECIVCASEDVRVEGGFQQIYTAAHKSMGLTTSDDADMQSDANRLFSNQNKF